MTRGPSLQAIVGLVILATSLAPACGTSVDLGGTAATSSGDAGHDATTCAAFAAPATSAPCDACKQGDNGCQANGCFNGYLCDSSERDCKAPGTPCATSGFTDGGDRE